jgi:uncharacterized membrane protein (UPF0136 family)
MTNARRDGLCLLLLGSLVFLLFGFALEHAAPAAMVDFGVIYYPARCLLQHGDPYNADAISRVYGAQPGDGQWPTEMGRAFVTRNEYPPTAYPILAPLAMLSWEKARNIWLALIAGSLILAAFLIWDICADQAPAIAGAIIGFLLANCVVAMVLGNVAGIVIAFCAIAVWCFFRERFVWAGVLCLAASLALKPHETGFVWLALLLAGGSYRKRALQTLCAVVAIALPSLLWVWSVSPHWAAELHANLAGFLVHGGTSDPGPASAGSHGIDMLVNLQAAASLLRDDPRFYLPVAYTVSAALLLGWAFAALRSRPAPDRIWLSLAAISALSQLPVYHHIHDAKLILLAIPACVFLWARGNRLGKLAIWVTVLAVVFTGDLVWTLILALVRQMPPPATWLGGQIVIAIQVLPAPLAILLMGVFYLYVLVRQNKQEDTA